MPLRALIAEVISLSKRFKYTNDTSGEPHSHKKDTTSYLIFQDYLADFGTTSIFPLFNRQCDKLLHIFLRNIKRKGKFRKKNRFRLFKISVIRCSSLLITFYTVYNADFRNYFSKMPLYRIL